MSLKILDLFSGIGGFSYALKSIGKTMAYCEIDETCRNVIIKNIKNKNLENAPIFNDITKLKKDDIKHLNCNTITAGFPCTDISSANPNGLGIHGERSGLFKEILRIIDEINTIDILFLENSPRILKKGFKFIKKNLTKRGFIIKYCIINAKDVGALHKRQRWYCLCYKKNINLNIIDSKYINFNWNLFYRYPKILEKTKENYKIYTKRCEILGNSIVPQCAIYAWNNLVKKSDNKLKIIPYKIVNSQNIKLNDGITSIKKKYWATPCKRGWGHYRSLTNRGIGILANQLYYDETTLIKYNDKKIYSHVYITNPCVVELLMGYDINWTNY